jgi:hypothetical protein
MKKKDLIILTLILSMVTLTALHITRKPKAMPVKAIAVCGKPNK